MFGLLGLVINKVEKREPDLFQPSWWGRGGRQFAQGCDKTGLDKSKDKTIRCVEVSQPNGSEIGAAEWMLGPVVGKKFKQYIIFVHDTAVPHGK
jgi:hypothetical protein